MANVWLELSLNPPCHRSTAWESLVNVEERRREGVYVAGEQLCAAVLSEAVSEHGENMRVLATSKTSEGVSTLFSRRLEADGCTLRPR